MTGQSAAAVREEIEGPVKSSQIFHNRFAVASSNDIGFAVTSFWFAKYFPVIPSTSGEDAKWIEVLAPFSGEPMNSFTKPAIALRTG